MALLAAGAMHVSGATPTLQKVGAPSVTVPVTFTRADDVLERVRANLPAGPSLPGYPLYTQVAAGENGIELTWDPVPQATRYDVYRSPVAGDASGATYLLVSGIAATTFTDDGSAAVALDQAADDGVKPLPPGSLTRWRIVTDDQGQPVLLNQPREGLRAVIVSLADNSDPDTPRQRAFLYAAGGRVDDALNVPYLDTIERPFQVHNVHTHPSWLERYPGPHPPQIMALREDLARGRLRVAQRDNRDVERLLANPAYRRIAAGLDRVVSEQPGTLLANRWIYRALCAVRYYALRDRLQVPRPW